MPCRFLSTPSARRATRAGVGQVAMESQFLSTPSARRATIFDNNLKKVGENFYPRPPRGGRRISPDGSSYSQEFLSTPSARRATWSAAHTMGSLEFLSTPSARRATRHERRCHRHLRISIHALREEGDDKIILDTLTIAKFLSTPSARRATSGPMRRMSSQIFLSTPSARRATTTPRQSSCCSKNFYPRPPRGGRPRKPTL